MIKSCVYILYIKERVLLLMMMAAAAARSDIRKCEDEAGATDVHCVIIATSHSFIYLHPKQAKLISFRFLYLAIAVSSPMTVLNTEKERKKSNSKTKTTLRSHQSISGPQ